MAAVILGIALALVVVLSVATRALHKRASDEVVRLDAAMMGVLGVLTALLVTFLANNVWNDNAEASDAVRQEVRALEQTIRVADHLPELKTPLRQFVQQYAAALID